jgi:hypothetical protein
VLESVSRTDQTLVRPPAAPTTPTTTPAAAAASPTCRQSLGRLGGGRLFDLLLHPQRHQRQHRQQHGGGKGGLRVVFLVRALDKEGERLGLADDVACGRGDAV